MLIISHGSRLNNKQPLGSLLVLFDFNRTENCLSRWCSHLNRGWGIILQHCSRGCEGGIVRLSNSFGAFLSFFLLLALAPRALASNLVINSVLRRIGIFFIVLIDASKLGCCSLLVNLSVFLARIHFTTFTIVDQLFLDSGNRFDCLSLSFLGLAGSGSLRRSSSIFCRLILKHLTNCDCATFVTKGEATELRDIFILLQSDWDTRLDAANNLGEATCELRLLLLNTFSSLFTLLIWNQDLLYCTFICNCVNVKDALVSFWKNRLIWNKF